MWPNSMLHALAWCRSLVRLVRSWWVVDRIRVSPREGRLLRLGCGTLLRIRDEWFEIESRTVTAGPGTLWVTYECTTPGRRTRLRVRADASRHASSALWYDRNETGEIDVTTVEVFERQNAC